MIGKIINHYEILEKLGQGGMGVVYKARDTKLDRFVALKFLPRELTADIEAVERFRREAKATAALNHPNIITIYEIGEHEDQLFIAMEYVEGKTLRDEISEMCYEIGDILQIFTQICDGLGKAHEKGIGHRDIKPANIIIDENSRPRILDFGLAKLKGSGQLTKEMSTIGTVKYMSPEQATGKEVDHRTDIWSLGVVLYEMLSGKCPFEGEYDQALIYSILNEQPSSLSGMQPEFTGEHDKILLKMLAKDPLERYQDLNDLLEDIRSFQSKLGGEEPTLMHENKKVAIKSKVLYMAAAAIFMTILIGVYLTWIQPGSKIDTIAVLPFINTSADPELEYLSDGMTESIISSLSKLPNMKRVIARSSVFQYKGKDIIPGDVGKELGVEALLISRISQREDELSISVELVNTEAAAAVAEGEEPPTFEMTTTVSDGTTFYAIVSPNLEKEIHYVFIDSYLVMAPSNALLLNSIDFRETGYTLKESANFIALLPEDGEANFSALFYQDFGSLLQPLAEQIPSSIGGISEEDMSQVEDILGSMEPTLMYAYGDPDQITLAGTGDAFGALNLAGIMAMLQEMGATGEQP